MQNSKRIASQSARATSVVYRHVLWCTGLIAGGIAFNIFSCPAVAMADEQDVNWLVGASKLDITPSEGLRLSGYATRNTPSTGVRDPLHVRVIAITAIGQNPPSGKPRHSQTLVLVSIDSIMISGEMTRRVADWAFEEYEIPPSQVVLSSTHSHAAPHLAGGLTNLFREPQSQSELDATQRYTERVETAIRDAIKQAIASRREGKLQTSEGKATFAVNRRVLDSEGLWSGFGLQEGAAVDHRVRVLSARDENNQLIAAAYMYACHCTTLGGDFNEVSGDWAGLSASRLEQLNPDTVFLPIIGCGANANPEPRGTYEHAQQHAAEIVDAASNALSVKGNSLTVSPTAHFGYAALPSLHPSNEEIESKLRAERPNDRRWAEEMQRLEREMGRLPESYPMPIHTWNFGDQLTWVFLGGEVVVEYQFLIEKELGGDVWVAAYCNDVFAYVASENMLPEGGYEVDYSMIYYLQPGRWRPGTQALILKRVREVSDGIATETPPRDAAAALDSLRLPEGFTVDLVAAEPLVQDPINVAFGIDGSVWVVEMGDYPLGQGRGCVKRLFDDDGDGRMDRAATFLDNLEFPTSVTTHRDGILVVAAPHILFARDTDGDNIADDVRPMLSGIAPANPQHRASGFTRGLDGRIHFAVGDDTKTLSTPDGVQVSVSRHDVAWDVQRGTLETTSGPTQFVRARDRFGNWFGNSNSHPIFHYVIEDRYRPQRATSFREDLLSPAVAPPVLPRSQELSRFNDLYAHSRFTSACSSIVSSFPSHGSAPETAYICEPVHNLVARFDVEIDGATFSASRHAGDTQFDFLTSDDTMFRPVRVVDAPDGSLWVVDMARKVIEHPEWIPMAWQQKLDLREGNELGRIYRVSKRSNRSLDVPKNFATAASLADNRPAVRELAVQALLEASEFPATAVRQQLTSDSAEARVSALGALAGSGNLTTSDCTTLLDDSDPSVVRYAIRIAERAIENKYAPSKIDRDQLVAELRRMIGTEVATRDAGIQLQWLLTASRLGDEGWQESLRSFPGNLVSDPWLLTAWSMLRRDALAPVATELLLQQIAKAHGSSSKPTITANAYDQYRRTLGLVTRKMSHERLAESLGAYWSSENKAANSSPAITEILARELAVSRGIDVPGQERFTAEILAAVSDRSHSTTTRAFLASFLASKLFSEEQRLRIGSELVLDSNTDIAARGLDALGSNGNSSSTQFLIRHWGELPPQLRAKAGNMLLRRSASARALVESLESNEITVDQLELSTISALRQYSNRELRNRAIRVLGRPTERAVVVADYLANMPSPAKLIGDASALESGKRFVQQNCAVCHSEQNGHSAIGPPLENLKHWTLDQWVTAVMNPNQAVDSQYLQTIVLNRDGEVTAGVKLEESKLSVTLAKSDGSRVTIPTGEIAEQRLSKLSLMPEGFEDKLSPDQLAALIAYLRSR